MVDWQKVLVRASTSIKDAILAMDACGFGILLVVDERRKLLGTVTDGDIRRGLIKKVLPESVGDLMNDSPTVASEFWSKQQMLDCMNSKQLLHLPVTDGCGKVIYLETLQALIQKPKLDNPVFLMAGGFDTRLHPLTLNVPKPMIEIGGKPLLATVLQSFIDQGFHRFYFSLHFMPDAIVDYFGDGQRWGVSISYVEEKFPLGTAGALGLLPTIEDDLPIIVMNGDLLSKINYVSLISHHIQSKAAATICVREHEYKIPYGVMETDDWNVIAISEKPTYTYHINAGIYVLNAELVRSVERNVYLDMPMLLESALKNEMPLGIFPVYEYWLDIGRHEDLEKAENDYQHLFND